MPVILSSAYMPPISFFTAMSNSGEVLIEQHDFYRKQTYRNRCVIASAQGVLNLTVPVENGNRPGQLMKDVRISEHGNWRHLHWNALESAYMNSPFFMYYQDDLRPFFERRWDYLIDFNTKITQVLIDLCHVKAAITRTQVYNKEYPGNVQDLRALIDPASQPSAGTRPYWQVFSRKNGFQPNLSILDLLFNMGPETPLYL